MRRAGLLAATLVACLLAAPALAGAQARFAGVVTRIADGDTLDITANGQVRPVRLDGIDAPELGQAFGRAARTELRVLALSRNVTAIVTDQDRYGRTVARVLVGTVDLSEEMVRRGLAWQFVRYSRDARLAGLEQEARQQRRGLWAEPRPIAPWDYRASGTPGGSRSVTRLKPRAAAPVKPVAPARAGAYHGNTASRIYHAPGCRDYDCKHCTAAFMSRAAAEAAGYRAHEACVKGR